MEKKNPRSFESCGVSADTKHHQGTILTQFKYISRLDDKWHDVTSPSPGYLTVLQAKLVVISIVPTCIIGMNIISSWQSYHNGFQAQGMRVILVGKPDGNLCNVPLFLEKIINQHQCHVLCRNAEISVLKHAVLQVLITFYLIHQYGHSKNQMDIDRRQWAT